MIKLTIQILLADDHPVFRAGLKNIIEQDNEFTVIGEARSGKEIIELSKKLTSDLIVMDINMPEMDGIEATRQLIKENPSLKILVLTMYSDEAYLEEVLSAGASGYVLKEAVDTELISAIRIVLRGDTYIYPTLIPHLYKKQSNKSKEVKNDPFQIILSERESDVLKYISLGYTQKEISELLNISIKTVDTYKTRVMEKVGSKKRSDLVRFAIEQGLLDNL